MRVNVFLKGYKSKNGETRYLLIVREFGRKDEYIHLGPIPKRLAEQRRISVLHELLTDSYRREPTIHLLISEFVEIHFLPYAKGSRAPKTAQVYEEALRSFLKRFKAVRITQISQQDIERFFGEYRVSGRTKNILLNTLRVLFRKAVEWKYSAFSPVDSIKHFPEQSQGSRALTLAEFEDLWEGLTSWQSALLKCLIYSGMRPGELSNLKWSDIDWEQNRLGIVTDKTRRTKNGKTRYIPLHSELRKELLFLKDNYPARGRWNQTGYKPRASHQLEYVFCHKDGSQMKSFRLAITRALEKKGIKGVTPHGMRKTFATMLARQKVHPKVAQQLLGHANIDVTMRIYTEVEDDQVIEAVNALPSPHDLKRAQIRIVQCNRSGIEATRSEVAEN